MMAVATELSRMVRRKLETLALGRAFMRYRQSHGKSLWFGSGLQRRSTDPGHGYVARPFRDLVLGDAAVSE